MICGSMTLRTIIGFGKAEMIQKMATETMVSTKYRLKWITLVVAKAGFAGNLVTSYGCLEATVMLYPEAEVRFFFFFIHLCILANTRDA